MSSRQRCFLAVGILLWILGTSAFVLNLTATYPLAVMVLVSAIGGLLLAAIGVAPLYFFIQTMFPTGKYGDFDQTREVDLSLDPELVFDLCVKAIEHLRTKARKMNIEIVDRKAHRIVARGILNWSSSVNRVTLTVTERQDGGSTIMVNSKPAAATTFMDAGSNRQIADELFNFLEAQRN